MSGKTQLGWAQGMTPVSADGPGHPGIVGAGVPWISPENGHPQLVSDRDNTY